MSLTTGISLSPRNKSPYNPLPDERDPPTSINLPTVSASGTISYSRSSSSNSSPVTGKGFVDASLQGDLSHRAEQQDEREEETHLDQNNNKYLSPHPRQRYSAAAKGKGRQRDTRWDLDTMEMAQTPVIQEHEEVYNEPRWNAGMRDVEMGAGGYGAGLSEAAGDGWGGRSEEEAEEKRIQDNLASLAAKEAARRRAARTSKAFVTFPSGIPFNAVNPPSSTSSSPTMPGTNFSSASAGTGIMKRASGWFGSLAGGVGFGRVPGITEEETAGGRRLHKRDSDLPLNASYAHQIPQSPVPSALDGPSTIDRVPSPIPRPPSRNPFESDLPSPLGPRSTPASGANSPTRLQQPGIESEPRASGNAEAGSSKSSSLSSRSTITAGNSNRDGRDLDTRRSVSPGQINAEAYSEENGGWKGPAWHGGAGALLSPTADQHFSRTVLQENGQENSHVRTSSSGTFIGYGMPVDARGSKGREVAKDKWWYALCSWGNELDDGEDGQAGKTNPFE